MAGHAQGTGGRAGLNLAPLPVLLTAPTRVPVVSETFYLQALCAVVATRIAALAPAIRGVGMPAGEPWRHAGVNRAGTSGYTCHPALA